MHDGSGQKANGRGVGQEERTGPIETGPGETGRPKGELTWAGGALIRDDCDRWLHNAGCAWHIKRASTDVLTVVCAVHKITHLVKRHLQRAERQIELGCGINLEDPVWEALRAYVLGYAASSINNGHLEVED